MDTLEALGLDTDRLGGEGRGGEGGGGGVCPTPGLTFTGHDVGQKPDLALS